MKLGLGLNFNHRAINPAVDIVGDPGFDTPAYWSKDTGVTVSGSKAVWTAVAATFQVFKSLGTSVLVPGRSYVVTFTIDSISGGLRASIGGTAGTNRSAPGTYTETIVAGANGTIGIISFGASTTAQCDDFHVVG